MPALRRCSAPPTTAAGGSRRQTEKFRVSRKYRTGHADPGDALRDRRGRGHADRLHAAAQRHLRSGAAGGRRIRPRHDVHGAHRPLRLRLHRAVGHAPARRHAARRRRPRHGAAAHADRDARREFQDRRRVHRLGRRDGAVHADLCALASAAAGARRSARGAGDDRDNSGATGRRSATTTARSRRS